MKTFFIFISVVLSSGMISGQTTPGVYNQALADSLEADEYGMKTYTLVILKTGSQSEPDNDKRNALFRGHLDNISRLVEAGKMIIAGPLGKNELSYRGIFVFNTSDIAETIPLLATDPAIAAGLLDYEIMNWYGSAALPAYIETHRMIAKKQP